MTIKLNLNLVLVLTILLVISIPIAYAVVEPSIIINMLSGQTTKPLQIKDFSGNEIFSVDATGTIFPSSASSYTVMGSRFNIITPTNTVFNFPSGQSGDSGNETEMVMIMTTSGTIDRLHFKYISNNLDIPTTVTVRKNFADTSLTLSNPASSSVLQSNLVNSFTFVAGDEISITMITGAGTGQGTKPYWSFEITQ